MINDEERTTLSEASTTTSVNKIKVSKPSIWGMMARATWNAVYKNPTSTLRTDLINYLDINDAKITIYENGQDEINNKQKELGEKKEEVTKNKSLISLDNKILSEEVSFAKSKEKSAKTYKKNQEKIYDSTVKEITAKDQGKDKELETQKSNAQHLGGLLDKEKASTNYLKDETEVLAGLGEERVNQRGYKVQQKADELKEKKRLYALNIVEASIDSQVAELEQEKRELNKSTRFFGKVYKSIKGKIAGYNKQPPKMRVRHSIGSSNSPNDNLLDAMATQQQEFTNNAINEMDARRTKALEDMTKRYK